MALAPLVYVFQGCPFILFISFFVSTSVISQLFLSVTRLYGGHPLSLPRASRQFCSPSTAGFSSQSLLPFFPSGISEFGLYFQAGTYTSKIRLGCTSIFPPLPSYVLADAVSMCSVDVILYSLLDYFVIHMYIFLLSFNSCMRIGSDLHVHLRYGNF